MIWIEFPFLQKVSLNLPHKSNIKNLPHLKNTLHLKWRIMFIKYLIYLIRKEKVISFSMIIKGKIRKDYIYEAME